jgi:hypothetical protein
VTEEPSDLPAFIGDRIFLNEFVSHGNHRLLTYVRSICAKDYTGEMSASKPKRPLLRHGLRDESQDRVHGRLGLFFH